MSELIIGKNTIRKIGTENIYISTDRKQVERKNPTEEFMNFVKV